MVDLALKKKKKKKKVCAAYSRGVFGCVCCARVCALGVCGLHLRGCSGCGQKRES